jgi:phosphopantothenoylcysteine synthetase/decarboxylase
MAWQADFTRLLLVISGSVNAAFTPVRLNWLRSEVPDLDVKVVVTANAEHFVTRTAISVLASSPAVLDEWDYAARPGSLHTALADWAEAIVVIPATLQYIARVALGLADSPSVLAIQCTDAPVVIAPSLPPGGWDSQAMRDHAGRLSQRPNVSVIPPVKGLSYTTGRMDGYHPPPLPAIFGKVGWMAADS